MPSREQSPAQRRRRKKHKLVIDIFRKPEDGTPFARPHRHFRDRPFHPTLALDPLTVSFSRPPGRCPLRKARQVHLLRPLSSRSATRATAGQPHLLFQLRRRATAGQSNRRPWLRRRAPGSSPSVPVGATGAAATAWTTRPRPEELLPAVAAWRPGRRERPTSVGPEVCFPPRRAPSCPLRLDNSSSDRLAPCQTSQPR